MLEANAFLRFLAAQKIDYLILPKTNSSDPIAPPFVKPLQDVAGRLQSDPDVRRVDDRDYYLLDLSARHRRDAAR